MPDIQPLEACEENNLHPVENPPYLSCHHSIYPPSYTHHLSFWLPLSPSPRFPLEEELTNCITSLMAQGCVKVSVKVIGRQAKLLDLMSLEDNFLKGSIANDLAFKTQFVQYYTTHFPELFTFMAKWPIISFMFLGEQGTLNSLQGTNFFSQVGPHDSNNLVLVLQGFFFSLIFFFFCKYLFNLEKKFNKKSPVCPKLKMDNVNFLLQLQERREEQPDPGAGVQKPCLGSGCVQGLAPPLQCTGSNSSQPVQCAAKIGSFTFVRINKFSQLILICLDINVSYMDQ